MITLRHAALFALLLACTPKENDTQDGSSSEGGTSGGLEGSASSATMPTSGTPPTSSASEGTGGGSDGMSETSEPPATATSATTDETSTTDDPGEEVPAACEAMCARVDECIAEPPQTHDECVEFCVGSFGGPMCDPAAAAFWNCVAMMSCEELMEFQEEGPTDVCVAELGAVDMVCDECGFFGMGGGGTCSIGRECGVVQEYVCDGEACSCLEDGVTIKMCPDDGVCDLLEVLDQAKAAEACCGWDWPA